MRVSASLAVLPVCTHIYTVLYMCLFSSACTCTLSVASLRSSSFGFCDRAAGPAAGSMGAGKRPPVGSAPDARGTGKVRGRNERASVAAQRKRDASPSEDSAPSEPSCPPTVLLYDYPLDKSFGTAQRRNAAGITKI